MSIKWNIPADFYSNDKFVYCAPAANNTFNPFSGSIFKNMPVYPPMPTLTLFPVLKTIPLTGSSTAQNNYSNGISLLGKNQNSSLWTKLGYNAQKGYELTKNALSNAVGFTGYCAKYVKSAIAKTGLGQYESGHACDMAQILRRNKNFKEISPIGVDLNTLPAGCVLVYDRGVSGASSTYGHTEITDGNGRGISDGIKRIKNPSAIFMPVSA